MIPPGGCVTAESRGRYRPEGRPLMVSANSGLCKRRHTQLFVEDADALAGLAQRGRYPQGGTWRLVSIEWCRMRTTSIRSSSAVR